MLNGSLDKVSIRSQEGLMLNRSLDKVSVRKRVEC